MELFNPILAASDFWMAKWLTPMWFVGLGVAAGLVLLMLFLGVCFALKGALRGLDPLRKNGVLHWVALGITLVIGAGISSVFFLTPMQRWRARSVWCRSP